jgi:hypothetical protein
MRGQDSGLSKWASRYDADAFPDGDKLIAGEARVLLDQSERPMDLNVGVSRRAEAKVQTEIAGGKITGLT